jgi:hypothetical protein
MWNDPGNSDNRYLGSISVNPTFAGFSVGAVEFKETKNHTWRNDVTLFDRDLGGVYGLSIRAGHGLLFDHITLVGKNGAAGAWVNASTQCSDPRCVGNGADFPLSATLTNTAIQGFVHGIDSSVHDNTTPTLMHASNNLSGNTQDYYGLASSDKSEAHVVLAWDSAKYGRGAYLMHAANAPAGSDGVAVGAEVLYRYVDGVVTSQPLWPWPMEERIWNETKKYTSKQQSATWDGAMVNGVLRSGGFWKSLDAVYPAGCP